MPLFGNMLGAVMGNLELALDDVPGGTETELCIRDAMKASERAAEISRFMLTYLGQTAGSAKPVDPSYVIRESLSLLGPSLPGNGQVKTETPSSGHIIRADGVHLTQILTSLIANAV